MCTHLQLAGVARNHITISNCFRGFSVNSLRDKKVYPTSKFERRPELFDFCSYMSTVYKEQPKAIMAFHS